MIEFLKGKVHSTDRGYLVLESNGIGYIVNMVSREESTLSSAFLASYTL